MVDSIPVQQLRHTTVVVRDLREATRNYAEVYGIDRWRVIDHRADRLSHAHAFGSTTPFSFATAIGSNPYGVTFQLVQPTGGFSTFQEFLLSRGPGVHGFSCAVLDETEFEEVRRWLESEQIPLAQTFTLDGAVTHHFFDLRSVLGHFYLQVSVPHRDDWETVLRVDEEWDLSGEVSRPDGVAPALEIERVGHFGIAVGSIAEKLPRFARLFGLPSWRGVHFSRGTGFLQELQYRGEDVDHDWMIAITSIADFGLELLQPFSRASHYRVDYLDHLGDGIQHMLLHPAMKREHWPPLREWMEGMGAPVILTGTPTPGDATFYYTDTRQKLGGYIYEVICRDGAPTPVEMPTSRFEFEFEVPR